MALRLLEDPGPAAWLAEAPPVPWSRLVTFGPPGFEAWARLRFIPDPVRAGQREAEVDLGPDHEPDADQAWRALKVLREFTTTPDDVVACLWEGFPHTLARDLPESALLVLPHRRYAVLQGTLDDLADWVPGVMGGTERPPAFVWPTDRRWVLACDVDPHWAGIGASRRAVEALLGAPGLDVVPADPAEPPPAYR